MYTHAHTHTLERVIARDASRQKQKLTQNTWACIHKAPQSRSSDPGSAFWIILNKLMDRWALILDQHQSYSETLYEYRPKDRRGKQQGKMWICLCIHQFNLKSEGILKEPWCLFLREWWLSIMKCFCLNLLQTFLTGCPVFCSPSKEVRGPSFVFL